MNIIENLIRVYKLARHVIVKLVFAKEKHFEDPLMESLNSKGYYVCREDEIDCEELSKIVKQSIQKYFPLEKGDLRLYGIDDESSFVKKNFHKVINLHKNRIKSIYLLLCQINSF